MTGSQTNGKIEPSLEQCREDTDHPTPLKKPALGLRIESHLVGVTDHLETVT